jgi:hypothetical protein
MSRIIIRTYDGDPANYNAQQPDTPANIGNPDERTHEYTDGEDLLAVRKIAELLDEGTHFDVRQWVN